MTKTVEYRTIPHDVWTLVRFERDSDNGSRAFSSGSSHCGEFPNEEAADKFGAMVAAAEPGAVYISRASKNRPASTIT